MITYSNTVLKGLTIHRFGNEEVKLSSQPVSLNNPLLNEVLIKYFFQSFKEDSRFRFDQSDQHPIFSDCYSIFLNPELLLEKSQNIATHLWENSSGGNIKSGDFFAAYFEDCVLDDEIVEVIGLFKAETKNTFLRVSESGNTFHLESGEGININRVDKGALIFNTESENGYVVFSIDNSSRQSHAQYWNNQFLRLKPLENKYYQTQQLVHMCQDFISETVPEEDKAGKIALLNDSMEYLKSSDTFSHSEFKNQVLQEPELIDSYEAFREESHNSDVLSREEVEISKPALKKSKKFIRSVIKLDKSFHVYVHGNREDIQKGFDADKNKNFYKLYFDTES